MKKKITLFISALIVVSLLCAGINVFAGAGIDYTFDESTSTLTINGSGAMDDYSADTLEQIPWYSYSDKIENVVISEGITHIGDYSFCRETELANVTLPDTLESIGTAAFAGNDKLLGISVPAGVEAIGDYAFGYDYNMNLTEGFTADCAFNSAAQQYCVKNYIVFNVPFSLSNSDKAVVLGANWQSMWSFTPRTDGVLTFYSTGTSDTFGLIYDADNYVYSPTFNVMRQSAAAESDDVSDDNLNFEITYEMTAGKTYYLSAKYRSAAKTEGEFDVHIAFECTAHLYEETIITEPTCITDGEAKYTCSVCGDTYNEKLYSLGHNYALSSFENSIAGVTCARCDDGYNIEFVDYINKTNPILDVVEDGIVNAKDYSRLIKMFKNQ